MAPPLYNAVPDGIPGLMMVWFYTQLLSIQVWQRCEMRTKCQRKMNWYSLLGRLISKEFERKQKGGIYHFCPQFDLEMWYWNAVILHWLNTWLKLVDSSPWNLFQIPPPPAPGSNPPCSTLFVANLGPTCTEEELTQALSRLIFSNLMLQNAVVLNGC